MTSSGSGEIVVSSSAELVKALKVARGGEVIVLESGSYGDVTLSPATLSGTNGTYSSNVTIKSLDADNPAVFDTLSVLGMSNLTFDGLSFEYEPAKGDSKTTPVVLINAFKGQPSENIAVINSTFEGELASSSVGANPNYAAAVDANKGIAAGYYAGVAIMVQESEDITIEANDISGFFRGLSIEGVKDIDVISNAIYSIRSDGITVGEVQNLVIDSNVLTDLLPWKHAQAANGGDHPDFIQFWTTNSDRASSGISIVNNVIQQTVDNDALAQGIFMRNPKAESDGSTKWFYDDVTISGNLIYNSHINSMVIGESKGLVVTDNMLVQNIDSGIKTITTPIIQIAKRSMDVTVSDNVVPDLSWDYTTMGNMAPLKAGAGLGWKMASNALTTLSGTGSSLKATAKDGTVIAYSDLRETLQEVADAASLAKATLINGGPRDHVAALEAVLADAGIIITNTYEAADVTAEIETRIDTAKDAAWSAIHSVYDSSGVLIERLVELDDGMTELRNFDANGMLTVVQRTDHEDTSDLYARVDTFDANGELETRVRVMDNGIVQQFNYDDGVLTTRVTTGPQNDPWTKEDTFNEDGTLESTLRSNPNGVEEYRVFDKDGDMTLQVQTDTADLFVWKQQSYTYNDDGELLYRTTVMDDGSETTQAYDVEVDDWGLVPGQIPANHIAYDYDLPI